MSSVEPVMGHSHLCPRVLLHPPGHVVGGPDSHLTRLRRLHPRHHPWQATRLHVRRQRRPGPRPPHPHRGGQLCRLLQGTETDRGQGAEEGRRGPAGGGGQTGGSSRQRGLGGDHLPTVHHLIRGCRLRRNSVIDICKECN